MLPPNSSTSNSDSATPTSASTFSLKRLARTTFFFLMFLGLFELGTWVVFAKTPLSAGSIRQFFWYGASYEAKLRELVNTSNLPPNSVLYAGWLGDGKLLSLPSDVDVTIYGMSFSGNLSQAMHELRPELSQRFVGGPGAPLSHTYAIYQVDKKLRKTRFGVIGVTSGAVEEVLLMNRGSLFSDSAFPYFFPRYKSDHGNVVLAANSLINSAAELRAALNEDPALWQRQLAVLEGNDANYRRFFFASDFLDHSVLGRFVRRGMSKRHAQAYAKTVLGPDGFQRDNEASQLFRALLRKMVRDMRDENVTPIVALFSLQGQGNFLYTLVEDVLREDAVPYVNSYDICSSDDRSKYQLDHHFIHDCDLLFAQRTLKIIDAASVVDDRH
jgi:hypothetical protein